jgi:hypothetical protein
MTASNMDMGTTITAAKIEETKCLCHKTEDTF